MADESISEVELEQSRESAAQLMERLAQRMGARRAVRTAAHRMQRAAHYVHVHAWSDISAGLNRAVRKNPVASILIAVGAGYFLGRALRSR